MSLSIQEELLAEKLAGELDEHVYENMVKERYYRGKQRLKDLQISIPPQLTTVEAVVGWASTSVDVLEERLDLEGFIGGEAFGIDKIFRANELDAESSLGHIDALVFGVGFIVVGKGREDEPDPLITIESPKRMTAKYDLRSRRLTAGLAMNWDDRGKYDTAALYTPDATIQIGNIDGRWVEIERDEHGLGRVPIARLVNQPYSGHSEGRSEITRAVRYYTDSAMRTLLGAEVAREFYSAPQRYALGAQESTFKDSDGNDLNPWSVIQGRVMALPYNDEDGVMPQVGQFSSNSPTPYFDQIRALAQMLAAETAIPASYLGFQTDNPASADAIRQMESRLVKRAERRQRQFGRAWTETARLAMLVRDGSVPEGFDSVRPIWRDASTPTRAAAADEAVKLIGAGVLLPDSEVTYNRIGLSDSDKRVLASEKRVANASQLVANLATAAAGIQTAQAAPAPATGAATPTA